MPGLLKKGAQCPKCDTPVVAVVRTHAAGSGGVTAEYFHEKGWDGQDRISSKARRKTRCKVFYADVKDLPDLVVRRLEVRYWMRQFPGDDQHVRAA